MKKAKVALAHKLPVVLHRMLVDGTTFVADRAAARAGIGTVMQSKARRCSCASLSMGAGDGPSSGPIHTGPVEPPELAQQPFLSRGDRRPLGRGHTSGAAGKRADEHASQLQPEFENRE